MGLTRLGRFTLTLAVLALLGYWVYTHPEILERLRTPRVPAPTPQAAPFPAPAPPGPQVTTAPPPQVPGGLSARERGRVQYQAGDYAGPFAGPDKQCGQQVLFGVYYAQRQANQAGGLRGRKVVVNFYDDQAAAEEAVRVAQTIAAAPQGLAVVGHCNSRATLAAGPLYESEGIPVITATSTNPDIAQLGDFIFRVVGNDNDQARALANA